MRTKQKRRRVSRAERARKQRQQTLLVVGLIVVVALLAVILVVVSASGGGGEKASVGGGTEAAPGGGEEAATGGGQGASEVGSGLTAEGYPYVGSPDAPVKMVEYSDYFCGHCGHFALEKAPQIEEEYVATGKMQFIVQYYALGKDARLSVVEAGACAADQGHFFEYHRLLFANQQQLGTTPPEQWKELLMLYAQQVGLDLGTFEACWEQGRHQGQILASIDDARRKGVSGTPSFLINGQLVVGDQPYETFQAAIEAALAGAVQ